MSRKVEYVNEIEVITQEAAELEGASNAQVAYVESVIEEMVTLNKNIVEKQNTITEKISALQVQLDDLAAVKANNEKFIGALKKAVATDENKVAKEG